MCETNCARPAWKSRALDVAACRDDAEIVPWHGADWHVEKADTDHHFPHLVMVDDVPMVGFFQSEKHGEANRVTTMRPGRYLARFFGDKLDNNEIENLTADVTVQAGAMVVGWTQDADEIEDIYVNGPSSCMSERASRYDGPCHPARVYAGPDLAVAWLGEQDDATARAIVWPDRKVYGGVYGDVSRMRKLLEAKGFSRGSFAGARIRMIVADDGIVMPYLDIADSAEIDGNVVILGRGGDVECDNTNGVSGAGCRYTCDHCGDRVDDDDTVYIEDICETWCDSCAQDTNYCDYSNERVAADCVEVHSSSRAYTRTMREDRAARYDVVYIEDRGEWWEMDDTFTCEDCGEIFHCDDRDDRNTGEDLCKGCADDRAENGDNGNVIPALPSPTSYADLEAAGQLRLPLDEHRGQLVVQELRRDGQIIAIHVAEIREQDSSEIPFRLHWEALGEASYGQWFKADGTCVTAGREATLRAVSLPPLRTPAEAPALAA